MCCLFSYQEEESWRGRRGRRKKVFMLEQKYYRKKLKETAVRSLSTTFLRSFLQDRKQTKLSYSEEKEEKKCLKNIIEGKV